MLIAQAGCKPRSGSVLVCACMNCTLPVGVAFDRHGKELRSITQVPTAHQTWKEWSCLLTALHAHARAGTAATMQKLQAAKSASWKSRRQRRRPACRKASLQSMLLDFCLSRHQTYARFPMPQVPSAGRTSAISSCLQFSLLHICLAAFPKKILGGPAADVLLPKAQQQDNHKPADECVCVCQVQVSKQASEQVSRQGSKPGR